MSIITNGHIFHWPGWQGCVHPDTMDTYDEQGLGKRCPMATRKKTTTFDKQIIQINEMRVVALQRIENAKKRMTALKKAGLEYGRPNYYKAGEYLRLIYPATQDKPRHSRYIGNKPEKQREALEAIARAHEYDVLAQCVKRLESTVLQLDHDIDSMKFAYTTRLNSIDELMEGKG